MPGPRAVPQPAPTSLVSGVVELLRQHERVEVDAATPEVRDAVPFLAEAAPLVEGPRRLVVREHGELELADPHAAGPRLRGGEQRGPHAFATMLPRDHQAEVGDVRTGRVEIAHDREAPDDAAVVLGHEPGDISTIEDEGSVEEAREAWRQMTALVGQEAKGEEA